MNHAIYHGSEIWYFAWCHHFQLKLYYYTIRSRSGSCGCVWYWKLVLCDFCRGYRLGSDTDKGTEYNSMQKHIKIIKLI